MVNSIKNYASELIEEYARSALKKREMYQAWFGVSEDLQPRCSRDCLDRWALIQPTLPSEVFSGADLGCYYGYFSFLLAKEKKCEVFGYDNSQETINICRLLSMINKNLNTCFFLKNLTPESVEQIPDVDVIFCFSIYHHWNNYFGREGAEKIMKILTKKCRKCLYFETGQPNEKHIRSSAQHIFDKLKYMQPTIDGWLKEFFLNLGFSQASILGVTPSHVSPVNRFLLKAEK